MLYIVEFSDRGCWYLPSGVNQTFLVGDAHNITSRYVDYLPTRCALMAKAGNFTYFAIEVPDTLHENGMHYFHAMNIFIIE